MTALNLPRSALPLLRKREALVCAGLTAVVAVLLLAFGPAPGDAEVHLYRTFLVQHGTFVWDNFWYEGDFPLVSYSLLYYLPAALIGNVPLVLGSVVASTALFASIVGREWGKASVWPSRAFGVFAAAPLFTGLYSYSLGFTMVLATLRVLQSRRPWLGVAFAALALGFSPLAFAFLILILASILLAKRRLTAPGRRIAAGIAALVGFELLLLKLFPSGGVYPFHLVNLAGVLLVCVSGALVARRARYGAPLFAFFVLWGATSCLVSMVASPIGGNWTRLSEVVFPVTLLAASLADFKPRRLVTLALAAAFVYDLAGPVLLIPYRLDNRPASASFWRPAIAYLQEHAQPGFRVEVVPTAAHWESYWIPHAGFALARGWYRQLDLVDNRALYKKHLDAAGYERWLRSAGVEYVLLPSTELDPVGGPAEARVLRAHPSGLREVYRTRTWTIFALAHPTPILTGPARSRIDAFGHTRISGFVAAPGRYLLRVHYAPLWNHTGSVCITEAPNEMTWLDARAPGAFSLSVASPPQALIRVFDAHQSCVQESPSRTPSRT